MQETLGQIPKFLDGQWKAVKQSGTWSVNLCFWISGDILFSSMKWISPGNTQGSSPHSKDDTQDKLDSSGLKTDTTIYSLKDKQITYRKWSWVGRITLLSTTWARPNWLDILFLILIYFHLFSSSICIQTKSVQQQTAL